MKEFSNTRSWIMTILVILGVLALICFSVLPSMAEPDEKFPSKITTTKVYGSEADNNKSPCAKGYKDESRCMFCHTTPSNKLIEADQDEEYNYPNVNTVIRDGVGYYALGGISPREVREFFDYLKYHNIDKAVIEIMSPGGSLFDAWTIVSYMDKFKGTVETRVRSLAASAGCLIFVGGDKGKRFVDATAILMWHELYSFKMFSVDTPTSTEDEAKILRKLQDNTNNWLASRTKLSKDDIDEKVKRKEFWIDGKEAIEIGFADGYIGRNKHKNQQDKLIGE